MSTTVSTYRNRLTDEEKSNLVKAAENLLTATHHPVANIRLTLLMLLAEHLRRPGGRRLKMQPKEEVLFHVRLLDEVLRAIG